MHPYKMVQHATTGEQIKQPWHPSKSAIKREEFRREASRELNIKDAMAANAIPGRGYDFPVDGTPIPTMNADGEIDPILSQIKHSGDDHNALWIPRWQTFCQEPHNDAECEHPVVEWKPKTARKVTPLLNEREIKGKAGKSRRNEMAEV